MFSGNSKTNSQKSYLGSMTYYFLKVKIMSCRITKDISNTLEMVGLKHRTVANPESVIKSDLNTCIYLNR